MADGTEAGSGASTTTATFAPKFVRRQFASANATSPRLSPAPLSRPAFVVEAAGRAILDKPITAVVIIDPADRYPADRRVMRGLTQPELAAAAGTSTSTLRGIERADIGLSDINAERLAQALEISTAEYRAAYQRARTRLAGAPA